MKKPTRNTQSQDHRTLDSKQLDKVAGGALFANPFNT
jgi:hypothetical protein